MASAGAVGGHLLASLATACTVAYLVLAVILLLNMLIAMMAKTFDNVWDAQELNHQFGFDGRHRGKATTAPPPVRCSRCRPG